LLESSNTHIYVTGDSATVID